MKGSEQLRDKSPIRCGKPTIQARECIDRRRNWCLALRDTCDITLVKQDLGRQEVEPEKKEGKLEDLYPNRECYKKRLNECESTIRSVSDMAHKDKDCPVCYPKKGTGKAVGQGVEEILKSLWCESRGCELWKKQPSNCLNNEGFFDEAADYPCRLYFSEIKNVLHQLESFYRKQYLDKIEVKLKDCGGWNLSVCTAIEELKQSKQ